jgi:hypothetical protein
MSLAMRELVKERAYEDCIDRCHDYSYCGKWICKCGWTGYEFWCPRCETSLMLMEIEQ